MLWVYKSWHFTLVASPPWAMQDFPKVQHRSGTYLPSLRLSGGSGVKMTHIYESRVCCFSTGCPYIYTYVYIRTHFGSSLVLARGNSQTTQSRFVGMAKGRASRGKECLGVCGTGEKCKRSRDKAGLPILLNKLCGDCKEQRCKAHCQCARIGSVKAKGRSAARGMGNALQKANGICSIRVPQSPGPKALPAAVGKPSAPTCHFLDVASFYERCCADVAHASEVVMASYMYNDESLQKVFLKRLRGGADFKLAVLLDAEMFAGSVPRSQKPRVTELREAGASVFLCKGVAGQGAFHSKALVVDRRYLYTGSANFTQKSRRNEELCFRITGPVVAEVLAKLSVQAVKCKPWVGK